jgi:DNA-binding CsgD family transcriptional regulator
VRELARGAIIISLVMSVMVAAERWLRSRPYSPSIVLEYGFAELGYFLAVTILLLVYALKYLFKSIPTGATALPDHFVVKYGISPREREIISMMLQGYGNRKISETLFISAMTVKNHIYHIYQKTGVANKIQLLNVINSPK